MHVLLPELGARRAVYRSHVIYFEETDSGIFVIRILGQQDPSIAFG